VRLPCGKDILERKSIELKKVEPELILLSNATIRVHSAKEDFEHFPTAIDCIVDFEPYALQKTLTDSDGRFSFVYPQDKTLAIFAFSKRSLLDKEETYCWLVDAPKGVKKADFLLSNNNLAEVVADKYFPANFKSPKESSPTVP
jgi:hypothetical protein